MFSGVQNPTFPRFIYLLENDVNHQLATVSSTAWSRNTCQTEADVKFTYVSDSGQQAIFLTVVLLYRTCQWSGRRETEDVSDNLILELSRLSYMVT